MFSILADGAWAFRTATEVGEIKPLELPNEQTVKYNVKRTLHIVLKRPPANAGEGVEGCADKLMVEVSSGDIAQPGEEAAHAMREKTRTTIKQLSAAECRALCKKYRDLREQESGRGSGLASKNLGGAGGLRQELWKHLGEFRPLTTEEMAAALGSMVPEGYALAEASADNVNAVQEQRSRDADEEEQERALAAQFMAEMAEDDAELQLGPPLAAEGVAEVGAVGAVAMEGAAAVGGEVEQDDDADGVDGFDRPSREAMGRL